MRITTVCRGGWTGLIVACIVPALAPVQLATAQLATAQPDTAEPADLQPDRAQPAAVGVCGGFFAPSCFVPHDTPGCNNAVCCEAVCAQDSFCCNVEWDGLCVNEAFAKCTCGGDDAGSCFVSSATPWCNDATCCNEVCAIDSFCCETAWDSICVGEANDLCCGGDDAGSCFVSHPNTACNIASCCDAVCAQDSFCCATQWDGICANEAIAKCSCGGNQAGSCFVSHATPACNNATCCNEVCGIDSFCCNVSWDGICVSEANDLCCGGDDAGNCFVPHDNTACDDTDCCEAVCAADPFCCNVEWDGICANGAQNLCGDAECPSPGLCTVSHPNAGCDETLCCKKVCLFDPFCCNVTWDSICANGAINIGCIPSNDACANAIAIGNGTTSFTNQNATDDGGPPCGGIGSDMWYTYTPGFTGNVTIDTFGSNYDTVLAAYGPGFFGALCPPLAVLLACDDDSDGTLQSEITVAVNANQAIRIRLGGFFGAQGSGVINIEPSNDDCLNATPIGGGTIPFSNVRATTDGPSNCAAQGSDIWFDFTPDVTGDATIDTFGSGFNTVISAYGPGFFGALCPPLVVLLACNDNTNGNQSEITVAVEAGQTIKLQVGGFNGAQGSGVLHIVVAPIGQACTQCGPGPHWMHSPPCPAGPDEIGSDIALVGVDLNLDCVVDTSLVLQPCAVLTVQRENPSDDSANFPGLKPVDGHLDVIDTEVIQMCVTGGGATLLAGLGQGGVVNASLGAIAEQTGNPAIGDSFFNVFFELTLNNGMVLYNHSAFEIEALIECVPPQAIYTKFKGCLPLFTSPVGGQHVANLVAADHSVNPPQCEGDIDGDGEVDVEDLVTLILDFGCAAPPADECEGDVDGDGATDVEDLVALVLNWGPCDTE